jgi:hypothetical protein
LADCSGPGDAQLGGYRTVVVDKSNVKVLREALAAHPKPL